MVQRLLPVKPQWFVWRGQWTRNCLVHMEKFTYISDEVRDKNTTKDVFKFGHEYLMLRLSNNMYKGAPFVFLQHTVKPGAIIRDGDRKREVHASQCVVPKDLFLEKIVPPFTPYT